MARLSKTTPFQIYSDNERPEHTHHDETVEEQESPSRVFAWGGERKDDGFVTESDDERKDMNNDEAQEGDDEKNYTRTSISSFPDSTYPTDHEVTPMHKPYTPTYTRPTSRRMQMSSPLRNRKFGTPYSEPRGSPRSRRKDFDADGDGAEPKRHPLVLLHITALPLQIPWSCHAMREALPQHVLDNLQLLKSKLSPTVLKRGILIPHPGDDYELLEEKLLEALELQDARISKCGHYRNRHSTDSTVTTASSGADSGMGSSVDGSDEEHCTTCHHHLHAAGSGKQKWAIKVYAANGLMRASAWLAAWSEMERVDVEIMPWIKDELRIKLDEMNSQALVVKEVGHEADELRINRMVEERLKMLEQDSERARQAEMAREIERIVIAEQRQFSHTMQEDPMERIETAKPDERPNTSQPSSSELPDIYRAKDIPLSILLRNYIFLLSRKPLNMAIFFLVVFVGGMMIIVGPRAISESMVEVSTLVLSKNANVALSQAEPVVKMHDDNIPAISMAPAEAKSQVEEVCNAATQAEDIGSVVMDLALAPDADVSTSDEKIEQQESITTTEPVMKNRVEEVDVLVEQGTLNDAASDEDTQIESSDASITSDPLPVMEDVPSTNTEHSQTEVDEQHSVIDLSESVEDEAEMPVANEVVEPEADVSPAMEDAEDKVEIPLATMDVEHETVADLKPEAVEVETDITSMSEDEDRSVGSHPLQLDMFDTCLPYSILLDSRASCSMHEQSETVDIEMH